MIEDQFQSLNAAQSAFNTGLEQMRKITSPLEDLTENAKKFQKRIRPQKMVKFFRDSMELTDNMKDMDFSHDFADEFKDLSRDIKEGVSEIDFSEQLSSESVAKLRADFSEFEGSAEEFVKYFSDEFIDDGIGKKSKEFMEEELVEMLEEFGEDFGEFEEERIEGWEEHEDEAVDALKVVGDEASQQADNMEDSFGGFFDWFEDNIVGLATLMEVKGLGEELAGEEEEMRQHHITIREMMGLTREEYFETMRDPILDTLAERREAFDDWRVQAEFTEERLTDTIENIIQLDYMAGASHETLIEYGMELMEMEMLHEAATDIPYEQIIRSWEAVGDVAGEAITEYSERLDYLSRTSQATWDIQEEGWEIFEELEPVLRQSGIEGERYRAILEGLPPTLAAVAETGMDVGVAQEFLMETFLRADPAALQQDYPAMASSMEEIREHMMEGNFRPAVEALADMGEMFGHMERKDLRLFLDRLGASEELITELVATVGEDGEMAFEGLLPYFDEMNELALDAEGATDSFITDIMGLSPLLESIKSYAMETAKQFDIIRDIVFTIEQHDIGMMDIALFGIIASKAIGAAKAIWFLGGKILGFFGVKGAATMAVKGFGTVLGTTLGLKAAPILAVGAGIYFLRTRWDEVTEFMGERFEGLTSGLGRGLDWLESRFGRAFDWVRRGVGRLAGIVDWVRGLWPFGDEDDVDNLAWYKKIYGSAGELGYEIEELSDGWGLPKWLTSEYWEETFTGWNIELPEILTWSFWKEKLPFIGEVDWNWSLPEWLTLSYWTKNLKDDEGEWDISLPRPLTLDWWKEQFDKLREREWELPDPLTLDWWKEQFDKIKDGDWSLPQPLTLDWWKEQFDKIKDGDWSLPDPLTLDWWRGLFTSAREKMQGDDWLTWPQPLTLGWWGDKFGSLRSWMAAKEWSLPQPLTISWWKEQFDKLREREREWELPDPINPNWWGELAGNIQRAIDDEDWEFEMELGQMTITDEDVRELEEDDFLKQATNLLGWTRHPDEDAYTIGSIIASINIKDIIWDLGGLAGRANEFALDLFTGVAGSLGEYAEKDEPTLGEPLGIMLAEGVNLSVSSIGWFFGDEHGFFRSFADWFVNFEISEDGWIATADEVLINILKIEWRARKELYKAFWDSLDEGIQDAILEYGPMALDPTNIFKIIWGQWDVTWPWQEGFDWGMAHPEFDIDEDEFEIDGEMNMSINWPSFDSLPGWMQKFLGWLGFEPEGDRRGDLDTTTGVARQIDEPAGFDLQFDSPYDPFRGEVLKDLISRAEFTGAKKMLTDEDEEIEIPELIGFQHGGLVSGYGGGDRVPAVLERGEAVIPKESVKGGLSGILSFLGSSMDLGLNFIFPDYKDLPDWFRTIINWSPMLEYGDEEPLEPELEFRQFDMGKIRKLVGGVTSSLAGAASGTSFSRADGDIGTGVKDFVESVKPAAMKVAEQLGIADWRMIAAQWGHESGWGESGLSDYWNLAGIKAVGDRPAVDMGTWEVYDGSRTDITAGFEVFEDMFDFAGRFTEILGLDRYGVEGASDIWEYGTALMSGGYATDPKYAEKLAGVYDTVVSAGFGLDSGDEGIWDWIMSPGISDNQQENLDSILKRSEEPFWGLKELGDKISNIFPERRDARVSIDDSNMVSAIENNTKQIAKRLDKLIDIAQRDSERRGRNRDKDSFISNMRRQANSF